jgi:hypothetical protein
MGEEFVRHLPGRPVDESLSRLRQVTSDPGVDVIAQARTSVAFDEVDLGSALRESLAFSEIL